jgi:hypothetical protein
MRRSPFAPALASLAILAAVLLASPSRAASAEEQELAVGPFSHIEISGHADVVLVQGSAESVVVGGTSRNPVRVRVRSADGRLRIGVEDERSWLSGVRSARPPTITIRFRTLEALHLTGGVKVTSASIDTPALRIKSAGAALLKVDRIATALLRFDASGAAKAELEGTATDLNVSISGAGVFRAPKLVATTATAEVSGAGRVIVNAQKALSVSISGAGAVDYYGDPELKQRVTGAGKINRRSAGATTARFHVA